MRRVGKFPALVLRIDQHGRERRLRQGGTEQKIDRRRREDDVHRGDVAVGGVFLREDQRLLVIVGGEAHACNGLPVRQRANFRVIRPAHFRKVGGELIVKRRTFINQSRVVSFRLLEQLRNGHAIACPIGFEVFRRQPNRVLLVVGDENMGRVTGVAPTCPKSKTNAIVGSRSATARCAVSSEVGSVPPETKFCRSASVAPMHAWLADVGAAA